MPEITTSVTVNRPVSQVFRIAADTSRVQEWQTDIIASHFTEERIRVGVMVTQSRKTRAGGVRLDLNADVTDYQPNKVIGYRGVVGRFPSTIRMEFNPQGGATKVTETINIRLFFPFGFIGFAFKGALRRRSRNMLEQLKAIAEAEGGSAPTNFQSTMS